MKKSCLPAFVLLGFLFVYCNTFGQEKTARGIVIDTHTNTLIDSAVVFVKNTNKAVYTDRYGSFQIDVPKKTRYLSIVKQGYKSTKMPLYPGFQKRLLTIHLDNNSFIVNDIPYTDYKNALSLSVLELVNLAIGLRYERLLSPKHSIGLHLSTYIYGRNPITFGSEHDYYAYYFGIKPALFYRYYALGNQSTGLFIEGKIPFGYFHFYDIGYHYGSNSYPRLNLTYDMWTIGAAIALGGSFRLPKMKKGFINVSIGYQYFPSDIPEDAELELSNGMKLTMHFDDYWWYFAGPGSRFELKFTIGGIF